MSVDVKNYQWHPVWHSERSQDENYRSLPLDHIGALTEMERLAGQTNNNGSLSLYSDKRRRMTDEEVVSHLASRPEITKQRARKIFNRLRADKYLKVAPRTHIVVLTYWQRWQVKGKGGTAPSPVAGRQRDSRQRKRDELMGAAVKYLNTVTVPNMSQPLCAQLLGDWLDKTARAGAGLRDDMVKAGLLEIDAKGSVCNTPRPAAAPSAPPSFSSSASECEPVTASRDKSHIEENEEVEEEIDTSVSSNSVSNGEPPSFGGGRKGRPQEAGRGG